MVVKPVNLFSLSLALLLIAGLSACGDGDENDSGFVPGAGKDEVINPELRGWLLLVSSESEYGARKMDVATGVVTKIPNTVWKRQRDRFPYPLVDFSYVSLYNNDEMLVVAHDCRLKVPGDILSGDVTCFVFQGYDGVYRDGFDFLDDIQLVSVSRDGQYILAHHRPTGVSRLLLLDRQGNVLETKVLEDDSGRWMPTVDNIRWLPDGRMMYLSGGVVYVTTPYSLEVERWMTLPESIPGEITSISVAPDGKRVVLTVDSGEAQVAGKEHVVPWIMNFDGSTGGSGLRQLATSSVKSGVGVFITYPRWSPDGKWILVDEGQYVAGLPPRDPGPGEIGPQPGESYISRPTNYLIPSEDMGKVFVLSKDEAKRSPEVRLFYRPLDNGELTTEGLGGIWLPY